jgi:predicted N-formylglutamate amidohydrolase
MKLLEENDAPPFTVAPERRPGPFVIACDHAGRTLPRQLGQLGLESRDLERHIAWDIGAGAVSERLGEALGAFVIRQTYSRLVIDCNRDPQVPTSIVEISEDTAIPGNIGLGGPEREARRREIFQPYHDRLAAELDLRQQAGRATALIAMHSFTPVFRGVSRPWHAGVLYHRDRRLARIMLDLLRAQPDLVIGDNQPYAITDDSDYTVPVHGEQRGIPHVELEIRQDLIADAAGQRSWADLLSRLLPEAVARLEAVA